MGRVQITERDKRLLTMLEDYGLLATAQIRELVFKNTDAHTMMRRLRALRSKKLIQSCHGLPNGRKVWTLGDLGLRTVASDTKVGINRNSLEHDVTVSEVRMKLEAIGAAQGFRSSHFLKSKANQG